MFEIRKYFSFNVESCHKGAHAQNLHSPDGQKEKVDYSKLLNISPSMFHLPVLVLSRLDSHLHTSLCSHVCVDCASLAGVQGRCLIEKGAHFEQY